MGGSEGDADADEEDVEQLDDADAKMQNAVIEKPKPIIKKGFSRKKNKSRPHDEMKKLTVDHSSIKVEWQSNNTSANLVWKAPCHTHEGKPLEPTRYDIRYRKKKDGETLESNAYLVDTDLKKKIESEWNQIQVNDEKKGDGKVSCILHDLVPSDQTEVQIRAIWTDEGKEHSGALKDKDVKIVQQKRSWAPSFLTSTAGVDDTNRVPEPVSPPPPSFWNSRPRGQDDPPVSSTSLEAALDGAGKK